jgi:pimeloyl-ACP methyl ester carboxylesterase
MNGLTQSGSVDRRGRLLVLGALIAAALMLSLSAFSTSARAAESDPTIVLVHGAFASPAGWDGVAAALHKDGYQTATPALGLASVSDDVAIVRSTLDSIPGDKILVGHSYGGFVITNAASGRSDVRGLVYTAAYAPDSGPVEFAAPAPANTSAKVPIASAVSARKRPRFTRPRPLLEARPTRRSG